MTAPVRFVPPHVHQVVTAPRRRVYRADVSAPGLHVPDQAVISPARIRQVVCTLFRLYFGARCTFSWGSDGFMAEAWDDKGRRVTVQQLNHPQPQG